VNWWSLRAVGSLYVLKVSYVVLVIAPFLSTHKELIQLLGLPGWLVATLFLASFSLALANLVYDIWCPTIVKRFASPNDLYAKMLEIRKVSVLLYPNDDFDASLEHCKTAYDSQSRSRWFARWMCTILFVVSGLAFLVVFTYRGWVVFKPLICGDAGW